MLNTAVTERWRVIYMKNKFNDYYRPIQVIANLFWFGAWLYIIFGLHQSGWWILFPIVFHWSEEEDSSQSWGDMDKKKKDLIKLFKNQGEVNLYVKVSDVIMLIEKFWEEKKPIDKSAEEII